METSELVIYSSDWAAKPPLIITILIRAKLKWCRLAANINANRNFNDIKNIINNRSSKNLNLLFIGVDWIRKGGDFAVKIAKDLNDSGLKTTLHIAGIEKLPFKTIPDFIVHHGYISKRSQQGTDKIEQLFRNSHFLLMPSVADCTPVVLSKQILLDCPVFQQG